ncbi:fibronectin-binding protein [Mycobacterium sp.]|uniref:fibronectin-binding protein n=1 Tax=Mycobacterium sp. TaxID=1785 RepID=UPI002BCB3CAE|nr:fibronectin-binding protein [Mycobacterium sp.]HTH89068.1 fibronectin-binding protein [Mycobacterium sp.]
MLRRPVIAAAAVLAAGVYLATPTSADPGDNPCEFAINYFCKFIPIAPDLEGDVDLTTDQPPADPNAPPPESLPVVDPCAAGCI